MKATIFILLLIFLVGCKKDKIETLNYYNDFQLYYDQSSGFVGWGYALNIDSTGLMTVNEKREEPLTFERIGNYELLDIEVDSINQDLRNLTRIRLQNYGFGPNEP